MTYYTSYSKVLTKTKMISLLLLIPLMAISQTKQTNSKSKMTYYTFHINDSGAIEYEEESISNNTKILLCEMYNSKEYNKLNDILFTTTSKGYVLNDRALLIFQELNLPKYSVMPASVKREEKILNISSSSKSYQYNYLKFEKDCYDKFYNWIDFNKSDIWVTKGEKDYKKLDSHKERLDFIKLNQNLDYSKSYSFVAKKVVFNSNFDKEIDLFKIPFYSSGVYVSKRFYQKINTSKLTDVVFGKTKSDIGIVWKPYFPIIEFEK